MSKDDSVYEREEWIQVAQNRNGWEIVPDLRFFG
jgi:hypothetical protein